MTIHQRDPTQGLAPSLPIALGLLFVRSGLSSMDVPTRTAYVMAVVTPAERSAAASFTAAPRSLAAAISPALSGALFAAGSTTEHSGVPWAANSAARPRGYVLIWKAAATASRISERMTQIIRGVSVKMTS